MDRLQIQSAISTDKDDANGYSMKSPENPTTVSTCTITQTDSPPHVWHNNRKIMIYDCFTFFNELDLLEIRLNTLNDVVDRFVLVEATRTHSNQPKPLVFARNSDRFKPFLHKITHIVVDDYPEFETAWSYENHQRNCINRGLENCDDNDRIMISDADEIPDPLKVLEHKDDSGIMVFQQLPYYYYINHYHLQLATWPGTKMVSYRDFQHGLDHVENYGLYLPKKLNQGTTATKIRIYKDAVPIPDGGWHFTYLGGLERVREKIQAFSHEEYNLPEFTDLRSIEKRIRGAFTSHRLIGVEIDETYPAYLRNNKERYAHLIGPVTPPEIAERVRKRAWLTKKINRFKRLAAQFLTNLIPVKTWRKSARTYLIVKLTLP